MNHEPMRDETPLASAARLSLMTRLAINDGQWCRSTAICVSRALRGRAGKRHLLVHDGAQAAYDLRTVTRLREAAGWGGGRERRRVKGGKSGGLAAVAVVAASVAGTGLQKQDGSGMCRLRLVS